MCNDNFVKASRLRVNWDWEWMCLPGVQIDLTSLSNVTLSPVGGGYLLVDHFLSPALPSQIHVYWISVKSPIFSIEEN